MPLTQGIRSSRAMSRARSGSGITRRSSSGTVPSLPRPATIRSTNRCQDPRGACPGTGRDDCTDMTTNGFIGSGDAQGPRRRAGAFVSPYGAFNDERGIPAAMTAMRLALGM